MKVSAIIVTRGDVPLTGILTALASAVNEIIIWDNSKRQDVAVFGRYAAIAEAKHDIIFVQDDDCLVPVENIIAAYEPGRIVANMPTSRWDDYSDSCLVGWGAVFDRGLPDKAFVGYVRGRYGDTLQLPPMFLRECDVVFTTLTPHTKIDVGFQHLPWAEDPERAMFKRAWRKSERDQMYELARQARDG